MVIIRNLKFLIFAIGLILADQCPAQGIIVRGQKKTFTAKGILMSLGDLYKLKNADLEGGVMGNVYGNTSNPGHQRISVTVWKTSNGERTDLIYGCYTSHPTNGTYNEQYWTETRNNFYFLVSRNVDYKSTDIKSLVQYTNHAWVAIGSNFENWLRKKILVDIDVTIDDAYLEKFKVPGLPEYDPAELFNQPPLNAADKALEIFKNPAHYPNYVVMAAHRGYWRNAPENSKAAFQDAIDFGVEIIEIDVRKTADDSVMVAHDLHLGRLTNIPSHTNIPKNKDAQGHVRIDRMNFCEIRPDLCPGNTNPPIMLLDHHGNPAEPMPTLREVLRQCKGKVLVDIDKIDGFYYQVYNVVKSENMLDYTIVKGRYQTPDELLNPSIVPHADRIDWSRFMLTPVYFKDITDANGNAFNFETSINAYLTDSRINCPGVELIYVSNDDPLLAFKSTIENANRRVMQFPQFPENVVGVFNPKKFLYSDVDPRADHRNNWDWLLDKQHRPDLIISDRLEVLVQLLQSMGLRQSPFKP